jgi:hypothetical protein
MDVNIYKYQVLASLDYCWKLGTVGPLNVTVTYRKGSVHRPITQKL